MGRYKFYREHKYVSFALSDLEKKVAKADFCQKEEIEQIALEFKGVIEMLQGHAEYEDRALHTLLKAKNSPVYKSVEADHAAYGGMLENLEKLLNEALEAEGEELQIEAGYRFYLHLRKFVGDNLIHLHEEETIILPELQRLYSDGELKKVEAATYKIMTVEELAHMLRVLFPHMNPSDRKAFLSDIRECEPEKFARLQEQEGYTC